MIQFKKCQELNSAGTACAPESSQLASLGPSSLRIALPEQSHYSILWTPAPCTERTLCMHEGTIWWTELFPFSALRLADIVRGPSWQLWCVSQAFKIRHGTKSTHCTLWSSSLESYPDNQHQEFKHTFNTLWSLRYTKATFDMRSKWHNIHFAVWQGAAVTLTPLLACANFFYSIGLGGWHHTRTLWKSWTSIPRQELLPWKAGKWGSDVKHFPKHYCNLRSNTGPLID